MPEYDAFSAHQDIDKEIDDLLRARHLSPEDLRLVDDLGALLQEDDAGLDQESLQRVLSRLLTSQQAGQKAGSQSMSPVAFSQHRQPSERPLFMHNTSLPQATKKRRFLGVFTMLAAMLVVTLLVSGMLLAVRAAHQGGATAPGTLVTATPTLAPTPTSAPEPEGKVIYKSGETSFIWSPVWSPDGKRLAGALHNITLESWDALTGKNVLTYPITLSSTDAFISSASWSPDGTILAATVGDTVSLFNASNRQLTRTVMAPSSLSSASDPWPGAQRNGVTPLSSRMALSGAHYLTNVAWSPDGKEIAAGYMGAWHEMQQLVFVWNASTGTLIKTLSTNLENINSVSWSPRGDELAVMTYPGDGNKTQIWSTTSWNRVKTYSQLQVLAWSPDESLLALAQSDSVTMVHVATGQTVRQFSLNIGPDSLQWFPDGTRLLISGSGEIQVWNASSGRHISTLPYHYPDLNSKVQLSPDGNYISCILSVPTGSPGTLNSSVKYYLEILAA